jgi:hypothetical protein
VIIDSNAQSAVVSVSVLPSFTSASAVSYDWMVLTDITLSAATLADVTLSAATLADVYLEPD